VLVLPALVLAYLGQGALILRDPSAAAEPFFRMVPPGAATWALVLLSSLATVIASQALISGAFSLTRQAMLQGFLPRMTICHTARDNEGQIYIPEVNALLAIGCLALVLTFRESVRLAAAYGIAVTGTMAVTSVLYYLVVRYSWGWSKWASLGLLAFFLALDIPFLAANLFKFFDGGYVPMLIGAALIAGMLIWSHGRTAVIDRGRAADPHPRGDLRLPQTECRPGGTPLPGPGRPSDGDRRADLAVTHAVGPHGSTGRGNVNFAAEPSHAKYFSTIVPTHPYGVGRGGDDRAGRGSRVSQRG